MHDLVAAAAEPMAIDIPGGWVTVIVAIVTSTLGPAVLLGLGARLNKKVNHLRADAKATRTQVENSHTTNLRDDQDDKHAEVMRTIETVIEMQRAQGRDIGGMREDSRLIRLDILGVREDVTKLRTRVESDQERIRELEDTRPSGTRPRARRPQPRKKE